MEACLEVRPEVHPSAIRSTAHLVRRRLHRRLAVPAAGGHRLRHRLDGRPQPQPTAQEVNRLLRTMTGDAGPLLQPGLQAQAPLSKNGYGFFGPGP